VRIVDYFTKLLEDDLKAVVKPQYVDQIPKAIRAPDRSVEALIKGRAAMKNFEEVLDVLGAYQSSHAYMCMSGAVP